MDFLTAYDAVPEADAAQRVALLRRKTAMDRAGLLRELRAVRPVFATPLGVFVTRHPDVLEVLSTPEVFTVGVFGPALEEVLGAPFVLSRDGADVHWRERGYGQLVLAPEDAPRVRALTVSLADGVLDAALAGAAERGSATFDLIQDYAWPAAARVAVEYLGFTGIPEETLHSCTRRMQWAFAVNPGGDPDVHTAGTAAGKELHDRVAALIADRRASSESPDDVLGRMLRTRLPAEFGFDDERINANLVGYLTGYQQNATQCVATAIKELAVRPEVLAEAERAAAEPDPARFDAYVWEALRFHPFVPATPRLCVRDHVLAAGTPRRTAIPSGTPVVAWLSSAMFDEDVVESPTEFRTGRPPSHNLVLGYGAHDCLGRYAASVIVPELVRRVLLRPGVRPPPGAEQSMDHAGTPYPQHYTVTAGPEGP
ncbi:cytochrome P450 [Streptomyces sp. NBC_01275]|uniref:cytochrome P450 n=1 Tax=Streptomyces sp. NBC_01275 TaxID=2903807 RepID=UPI00224E8ADD|nr:cytochrome P450 [Streptomyces sp. NBC_01275]MCX4765916.1 cytochrome P450 [Streptomyces sp. NBC_01275]